jgi:hypothetical protein
MPFGYYVYDKKRKVYYGPHEKEEDADRFNWNNGVQRGRTVLRDKYSGENPWRERSEKYTYGKIHNFDTSATHIVPRPKKK